MEAPMSGVQICEDRTDCAGLLSSAGLFLKPLAKLSITVTLPKLKMGQSVSNGEIIEKLGIAIKPVKFSSIKVTKSTMAFMRFEAEISNRAHLDNVIKKIDLKGIRLNGFSDLLKIRATEGKLNFPTSHDWDSFFRDAKHMNEMRAGERPDTVVLKGLPVRWFCQFSSQTSRPNEDLVKSVMRTFGDIREVDIPTNDPLRAKMSATISGLTPEQLNPGNLFFNCFIQYRDFISFEKCMKAFYGKKLVYMEDDKAWSCIIEVDFDRTKHLTEYCLKKRREEREKLLALDREQQEKLRKQKEQEELVLRKEQEREDAILEAHHEKKELKQKEKEKRREKREQQRRDRKMRLKEQQLDSQADQQLSDKIAFEERKLLLAQRRLESIRLLDELLDRIKVVRQRGGKKEEKNEKDKKKNKKEREADPEQCKRDKVVLSLKEKQEAVIGHHQRQVTKAQMGQSRLSSVVPKDTLEAISSRSISGRSSSSDGSDTPKKKNNNNNNNNNIHHQQQQQMMRPGPMPPMGMPPMGPMGPMGPMHMGHPPGFPPNNWGPPNTMPPHGLQPPMHMNNQFPPRLPNEAPPNYPTFYQPFPLNGPPKDSELGGGDMKQQQQPPNMPDNINNYGGGMPPFGGQVQQGNFYYQDRGRGNFRGYANANNRGYFDNSRGRANMMMRGQFRGRRPYQHFANPNIPNNSMENNNGMANNYNKKEEKPARWFKNKKSDESSSRSRSRSPNRKRKGKRSRSRGWSWSSGSRSRSRSRKRSRSKKPRSRSRSRSKSRGRKSKSGSPKSDKDESVKKEDTSAKNETTPSKQPDKVAENGTKVESAEKKSERRSRSRSGSKDKRSRSRSKSRSRHRSRSRSSRSRSRSRRRSSKSRSRSRSSRRSRSRSSSRGRRSRSRSGSNKHSSRSRSRSSSRHHKHKKSRGEKRDCRESDLELSSDPDEVKKSRHNQNINQEQLFGVNPADGWAGGPPEGFYPGPSFDGGFDGNYYNNMGRGNQRGVRFNNGNRRPWVPRIRGRGGAPPAQWQTPNLNQGPRFNNRGGFNNNTFPTFPSDGPIDGFIDCPPQFMNPQMREPSPPPGPSNEEKREQNRMYQKYFNSLAEREACRKERSRSGRPRDGSHERSPFNDRPRSRSGDRRSRSHSGDRQPRVHEEHGRPRNSMERDNDQHRSRRADCHDDRVERHRAGSSSNIRDHVEAAIREHHSKERMREHSRENMRGRSGDGIRHPAREHSGERPREHSGERPRGFSGERPRDFSGERMRQNSGERVGAHSGERMRHHSPDQGVIREAKYPRPPEREQRPRLSSGPEEFGPMPPKNIHRGDMSPDRKEISDKRKNIRKRVVEEEDDDEDDMGGRLYSDRMENDIRRRVQRGGRGGRGGGPAGRHNRNFPEDEGMAPRYNKKHRRSESVDRDVRPVSKVSVVCGEGHDMSPPPRHNDRGRRESPPPVRGSARGRGFKDRGGKGGKQFYSRDHDDRFFDDDRSRRGGGRGRGGAVGGRGNIRRRDDQHDHRTEQQHTNRDHPQQQRRRQDNRLDDDEKSTNVRDEGITPKKRGQVLRDKNNMPDLWDELNLSPRNQEKSTAAAPPPPPPPPPPPVARSRNREREVIVNYRDDVARSRDRKEPKFDNDSRKKSGGVRSRASSEDESPPRSSGGRKQRRKETHSRQDTKRTLGSDEEEEQRLNQRKYSPYRKKEKPDKSAASGRDFDAMYNEQDDDANDDVGSDASSSSGAGVVTQHSSSAKSSNKRPRLSSEVTEDDSATPEEEYSEDEEEELKRKKRHKKHSKKNKKEKKAKKKKKNKK